MTEFYRFRSIEQLLGEKYQELERQTIYFASPEELNDPMEGFRDIVWSGDKIVWTNLFKHYVHSLFWTYGLAQVVGDTRDLKVDDILVERRWDEPPTPQAKIQFDNIWDRVFNKCGLSELIEKIANMKRKVRHNELLIYLWPTHIAVLLEIQVEFVKRGLLSESKLPSLGNLPIAKQLNKIEFFESMGQIEDEDIIKVFSLISQLITSMGQIEDEDITKFFSLVSQVASQFMIEMQLIQNNHPKIDPGILEKNGKLVLFDFPQMYLKRLEILLWPQWYTACFMKNYHNSSAWGHYGDGHKGVCLIFEAVESDKSSSLALDRTQRTFHEVRYAEKTAEIDFFRSIGTLPEAGLMKLWYSDENGNLSECGAHIGTDGDMDSWRKSHWENFYSSIIIKTKDWSYEQEHRLIICGITGDLEESQRVLNYDFNSLKGIIFGTNTYLEDKLRIIEIIKRKCREENRIDFKFFQADYSHESGDFRKYEIPLMFSGT